MTFWLLNGNMFDVHSGEFHYEVNLKICDGFIEKVGGHPNSDEKTVDCKGMYLTPGLMDMHTHMVWDGTSNNPAQTMINEGSYVAMIRALYNSQLSVRQGVTTVRDVGCCDDVTIHLNKAMRMGLAKGCDIIPCGSSIMGTFGHVPAIGRIADSEDELIRAVRQVKTLLTEAGEPCQWIKVMATGGAAGPEEVGPSMYSVSQLKAIVEEAHRLHMKVCAHALSKEGIINCIEAGIDSIEHGSEISMEYLLKMKEKGLAYVPTLSVYRILSESEGILPANTVRKSKKVHENQKATFKQAYELGVMIALGTDAGSMNFGEHPSVAREMSDMYNLGMRSSDVIKSATINCAKVLGIEKIKGSLEEGKIADIVILNKNPLDDISAFAKDIISVYKDGKKIV
ncbi:MAG: amidohydrolase family protein [Tissierellia bacterium]|nr:amidohydrolase family protein [Tissierellia bacterium]